MSSEPCLLIRQARILLPTGEFLVGDVQTSGREIIQVALEIDISSINNLDREIDATNLTLLPGVIEPQEKKKRKHTPKYAFWNARS